MASSHHGREGGHLYREKAGDLRTAVIEEEHLVSLKLSLEGNKGVLEKQGAGLQEKIPQFPEGPCYLHSSAFRLPSYHPRKRREKHWPQERKGITLTPDLAVQYCTLISWGEKSGNSRRAPRGAGSEHLPWHA